MADKAKEDAIVENTTTGATKETAASVPAAKTEKVE
ncbi:MAG: hypothetical protein ACI83B_003488, partial [Sediminicola sp.]